MNRKEYLDRLKVSLQSLSIDELNDILYDYEEHFNIGISKGKSEEEISKELGDPEEVASNYNTVYKPNYNINNRNSNDPTRRFLIALFLIAFNLLIVLGPAMALGGLLLGLYGISIGIMILSIATLFGFPISFFLPSVHVLTAVSFGIGLLALSILGVILAIYLTKLYYNVGIKYIKWNLKVINGQEVQNEN